MLHYLLPEKVATGSLVYNLDYYEPRSGRLEQAVERLGLTARVDLDDVGGVTAGGPHLAAMGSVWHTLAFGFAGLRSVADALAIDPVIAPRW
jgi:beta-phosphoglucomutase/alpha,alpha-trehalose phosphorylase